MEAAIGARLLGEVEETNLEEILESLRSAHESTTVSGVGAEDRDNVINRHIAATHLQELDDLANRHFRSTQAASVSISGRSTPLLYKVVSTLVSPPHQYAVVIIDLDSRFDTTRLSCHNHDLRHIYIRRPPRIVRFEGSGHGSSPEQLRALVSQTEKFMLYGEHGSGDRPWWGTIVAGGLGAGDLATGWRGWLRVDREEVRPFPLGISAEEALEKRSERQQTVDGAPWVASSPWGGFNFDET